MRKLFPLLLMLVLSVPLALRAQSNEAGPITQAILERGRLTCGVDGALPGFSFENEDGSFSGFDVDFCRAVAAAILGDADAVDYVRLAPAERAAALTTGTIDLLSRNTTWTFSRDTGSEWNGIFAPTTFYDGQGIMVKADSDISTLQDLSGLVVCTASGTTTADNMNEAMATRGLEYELLESDTNQDSLADFVEGRCDAFTTDRSGLAGYRASQENPEDYEILEIVLSKEPLGPVSLQTDPQFADIIRWTIYGMIQAEEFGIDSENVGDFLDSNRPNIQRLLGVGDVDSGRLMGIPNDFMVAVLEQVGNYGEVFELHLGPDSALGLDRGLNDLWTRGGLLYSPPFR
jgi:general L-amino acid transport system substrate-binding protein